MKTKIYANIIREGKVLETKQIGTAILDDWRVSGRKFNSLKREAMKQFPNTAKGEYMTLTTECGKVAKFGGYPCPYEFVRFV